MTTAKTGLLHKKQPCMISFCLWKPEQGVFKCPGQTTSESTLPKGILEFKYFWALCLALLTKHWEMLTANAQFWFYSQGGTPDITWLQWLNGGNNQNPKKSLGFPTKFQKTPGSGCSNAGYSNIHWIKNITIQQISITETNNCSIHWIEIYPLDSIIHLLNNSGPWTKN